MNIRIDWKERDQRYVGWCGDTCRDGDTVFDVCTKLKRVLQEEINERREASRELERLYNEDLFECFGAVAGLDWEASDYFVYCNLGGSPYGFRVSYYQAEAEDVEYGHSCYLVEFTYYESQLESVASDLDGCVEFIRTHVRNLEQGCNWRKQK